MEKMICRFSMALLVTSIVAAFIIPAVYRARGYMDIGGEWILLLIVFAIVYRKNK